MTTSDDLVKTRKIRVPTDDESPFDLGDRHLSILTFAILFLVVVMLVVIAEQAITTEKVFFRKVALRTNQQIADLISQQFAQVFSNTTGLLEDMSHFPSVVSLDHEKCNHLFSVIMRRHSVFRTIYVLDGDDLAAGRTSPALRDGKRWEWFNTNASVYRPLPPEVVADLRTGWVPSKLTDYYSIEGEQSITYACAIRDRTRETIIGILVAEIKLAFVQPVIDSAELGRTGDILVVDPSGLIVFSTRGFTEIEDFNEFFPVSRAYRTKRGGVEYRGRRAKLASYTLIRDKTIRPLIPMVPVSFHPTTITPREIPDWLIVVIQDAAEGYLVADRLKWNIIILLVIGAVGVFIIGKLWTDSLR